MSLEMGIVGLPNAGKSTLFNALTRAGVAVASYPFTTIEPNVGVAVVPDERLDRLAAMVEPERVTPATVTFVDIAGLVKGAHRGEGLGNQFLGHIRNVDAMALVLRCFRDENVPPGAGTLDPLEELEVLDLELVMADLAVLERRIEKVRGVAKARPRDFADELKALESLRTHLQQGLPAHRWPDLEAASPYLQEVALLTTKPRIYVANVGEEDLPEGGPLAARVRERAEAEGVPWVVLCAQLEMELADWPPEEAAAYRADVGLTESGLMALARAAYKTLGLITFFTIAGGQEVRAWPLPRGSTAPQAAGRVHSDMERGFIRAEVVPYEDLVRAGSWAAAREQGLLRIEGRDYVVQDGDVCLFRFQPPR
ncbi:MAG: redox-regulated ATPase YchF [Chloroflexi bacterium]|nr:MAG: redox-regulated ATPase YchF [Chloroflexota bacterium]